MLYLGEDGGVPSLSRDEIIKITEEISGQCDLDNSLLVDIEVLCDKLNINMLPVPNLSKKFYVDAFISADFKTIFVDEHEYASESARYRFSVAHELGHFVLHRQYYPDEIGGLADWFSVSGDLMSDWAENQANCFAGNLLVPEDKLVQVLNDLFDGSFVRNYWNASPMEIETIFAGVGKKFGVSEQVILHRMQDVFPGVGRDIYFIVNHNWRSYVNKK
ncbi:ImmA/IrrE family metallo-endopeptidase [Candidatus Saccharibacteria bacterium]|nr:ImmA/IrrE family metallo-endopeptidase [Candidatus Saccharibacteria bacterium]